MTHRNYKEEADISPQTQMEEKEYRKVDPWDIVVPILVVLLADSLPRIIGDAWIVSIIAFVVGVASFFFLAFFVGRILRKNKPVTYKMTRFLMVAIFAGILSLALLAKVVVSLLMDFPKLI